MTDQELTEPNKPTPTPNEPNKPNEPKEFEEIVANTIYELKKKFGETKITAATIHLVLKEVMELVEHYSCPGHKKKQHAITILKALVIDLVENEEEERIILEIIDKKIFENTIDLIMLAAKGKLNLNNKKTQRKAFSCIKSVFSIIADIIIKIINSKKNTQTNTTNTTKENTNNEVIARPAEIIVEDN